MTEIKPKENPLAKFILAIVSSGKEIVAVLTSIGTALWFVANIPKKQITLPDMSTFNISMEVLNIAVLVLALIVFSRRYEFHLPNQKKDNLDTDQYNQRIKNLSELEKVPDKSADPSIEDLDSRIEKIAAIIRRLLTGFKGFSVCLIMLYIFLLISDINKQRIDQRLAKEGSNQKTTANTPCCVIYSATDTIMRPSQVKDTVKLVTAVSSSSDSALKKTTQVLSFMVCTADTVNRLPAKKTDTAYHLDEIISNGFDNHRSLIGLITDDHIDTSLNPQFNSSKYKQYAINQGVVTIFDNFFNVLSTVFLLMAFYVLYHLPAELDKSRSFKIADGYWLPLSIALCIILFNSLTVIIGFLDLKLKTVIMTGRILSGIFNATGMALIVSRFISMEYFFKQSEDFVKKFYLLGTVVALPLYVAVQPLWGLFEVDVEAKEVFKGIILLLCFWGKIFFLLIVYYLLDKRWIHTYVYALPVSQRIIMSMAENLSNVSEMTKPTKK